jgi:Xaa-Pro aminopeptidase
MSFHLRQQSVRAAFGHAMLDALVVSHLPNVRYLCGFAGTAGVLIVDRTGCTLVVDFRYVTAARALAVSHPQPGLALALVEQSYDATLAAVLQRRGWTRIGIEAAYMPVNRFNKLSAALASSAPRPLDRRGPCPVLIPTERIVEHLRMVKDAAELAALRTAADRLSAVARALPEFVRPGRTEQEIAGDIDAAIRRAGFARPAFETIVASGPNSALPHARPTAREVTDGDGVVLDFGGVHDGYCVDLTRTVQVGSRPAGLARIFTAVKAAHAAAIAAVRPGIAASAVDAAAREVLAEADLADAFGHGTGHGLGLEVHEEPSINRPVEGLPDPTLVPGMVFTIEPGAYVAGIGGVRIEDDVLVVEDGCELLTHVPIEL